MRRIILSILYLGLVSCSSPSRIENQNHSLVNIKKVIISVIGEPRLLRNNQRVYYSEYFGRKSDNQFDPQKSPVRYYTLISVAGDRRPYDLDVEVIVEKKNGQFFEEIGSDEKLAIEIAEKIKSRLNQGLEDRNVIDDFRAF